MTPTPQEYERKLQEATDTAYRLQREREQWRAECARLGAMLAQRQEGPQITIHNTAGVLVTIWTDGMGGLVIRTCRGNEN